MQLERAWQVAEVPTFSYEIKREFHRGPSNRYGNGISFPENPVDPVRKLLARSRPHHNGRKYPIIELLLCRIFS